MDNVANLTRRQFVFLGTAAGFAALGFAGCTGSSSGSASSASGSKYKNGTYTGQSPTLDTNVPGDGYGVITITIENDKIVDASFQAFEVDGTLKDKNYGRGTSRYAVAQKAISAADDYTKDLLRTGTVEGVDAISGATLLYDQFIEATNDALEQASAK